jgi:hypothetical protein
VAADLVVDVPQRERRMVLVPLGHARGHAQRVLAVDRVGDRVRLATALVQHGAVGEAGEDLRVLAREPRRRGRGRGRERDLDAGVVQAVHRLVEPAPLELALARLDGRPREDRDAQEVDPRLAHELEVLEPDLLRPLLGVVVAAEAEAGDTGVPGPDGGRVEALGRGASSHGDESVMNRFSLSPRLRTFP